MDQFQFVCRLDEIPDGQGRAYRVHDQMVGIFRIGEKVFALDDRCPHAGASLSRGYIDGEIVRCRIHHWGFRLCDGVYVDEDKPGCNAASIPVRVVGDQIEIMNFGG